MKDDAQPRPRDLHNVIVRVPQAIREELQAEATKEGVSQNQLINGYLFTALFVLRFEPKCGHPEDLDRFFQAVESALERPDGLAFGAFNNEDWATVAPYVERFAGADFITPPQTRTDPQMPTTVAFSFRITKAGRVNLPLLIRMLRPTLGGVSHFDREADRQKVPV